MLACTDPIVSVLLSTLRGFRPVLRHASVCEDSRRVVSPHEIVVRGPCMHLRVRRYVQWPMYGDTCSVWTMVALTHVSHVAVVFPLLLCFVACCMAGSHLYAQVLVLFGFRCVLLGGFPFVRSGVRPLRLSLRVAWRVHICRFKLSSSSLRKNTFSPTSSTIGSYFMRLPVRRCEHRAVAFPSVGGGRKS